MLRLLLPAVIAALAAVPAAAGAARAPRELPRLPQPPLVLPGDEKRARAAAADRDTWIVGARPGSAAAALARRHGARRLVGGAYVVPRVRARALARALASRDLLTFAEPNRLARRAQAPPRAIPPDPLSGDAAWRDHVVNAALAPPPVGPDSPLLALIDSKLDASHPEFAGGNVSTAEGESVTDLHGTATAAVAAAPKNDRGILGIWPGMRALNVPLPARVSCADSARGIGRAMDAGADVINMSYGSASPCYAEFLALQYATANGINLVAAAGNEFAEGNPLEFPASLPHVLTVAALTLDGGSAFFSNENAAMDLGAPGVGILTAVPGPFDPDGTADGYAHLHGTSFAAPMVAAATAWVRAVRRRLSSDQVAQVVRLSARDVGRTGWDPATGFGFLNVGGALERPAPPRDPQEPNEDIQWVDGRAFERPDRFFFSGGRSSRLLGLLDIFEDPVDVYRVRLRARSRAIFRVRPRFGEADMLVLSGRARSISQDRHVVGRSRRPRRLTDVIRLVNRHSRAATAYLAVYVPENRRSLDAAYTLTASRR